MHLIELSDRELVSVLAGLRQLQGPTDTIWLDEIRTNAGQCEPLSNDEIDSLCERINLETQRWTITEGHKT